MDTLVRPGIVVAAHSRLDQDAVCRFLEQHEPIRVLAEVRSASLLAAAVAAHAPEVLVLSHSLPDMPAHPADFLRTLAIPPQRIIYILPDSIFDRAVTISLRQVGIRHVLSGPFSGDTLLQFLAAALPPPTLISCRRTSGSLGQSTVALGLFLYSQSRGAATYLLDRSTDRLLQTYLLGHPVLGPQLGRFIVDAESPRPAWPAVTIVDGAAESGDGATVSVVCAPALRRRTAVGGDFRVANHILGRCHPPQAGAISIPRLRFPPVDLLVSGQPLSTPALSPFRDLFHRLRMHEVTSVAAVEQSRPIGDL